MTETRITETTATPTEHPAIDRIMADLAAIELDVTTSFTLADAMREGSSVTSKREGGWVDGNQACALGAAYLSARARGYVVKEA